jgi:beta-ketoacyl synthase, N-terminal domain protein
MPQSIAITGQGIICAIGVDCESVLSSLKKEEHGISQIKYLESIHKELPVGEVKLSDNQMKDILGLPTDREVSRTSLLGAIALKQALDSYGLTREDLTGKRVALISGTTVGGMDVTERHYSKMLSDKNEAGYLAQHDCGSNTE